MDKLRSWIEEGQIGCMFTFGDLVYFRPTPKCLLARVLLLTFELPKHFSYHKKLIMYELES